MENLEEKKKRILVVDDEEDIRNALKETLAIEYTVYLAEDGDDAISVINNVNPDLVIMDIKMPNMDGLTACRLIKSNLKTRQTPVMFLTVKNQVTDTEEAFKSGADSYMTKPFSPEILLRKISEVIMKAEIRKSMA